MRVAMGTSPAKISECGGKYAEDPEKNEPELTCGACGHGVIFRTCAGNDLIVIFVYALCLLVAQVVTGLYFARAQVTIDCRILVVFCLFINTWLQGNTWLQISTSLSCMGMPACVCTPFMC